MKKVLFTTFALMLLLSVSSFATETRVLTMGDNNNILLDEANIALYPSRVMDYPNLAIGEFSNNNFNNFGINWKFGSANNPWVLGTYFSTLPMMMPSDYDGAFNGFGWDIGPMSNRRIGLVYGRALGGNNFGFGLDYISSSASYEFQSNNSEESFSIISPSFGLTSNAGDWDIAADFNFGFLTDKDAQGQVETEKDSYYDFSLGGRMFYQYNPNYTLVPHVGATIGNHGLAGAGNPGDTNTYKRTAFDVGVGINYEPAQNVLAVMDIGFRYYKVKHENTTGGATTEMEETTTTIPYFKIGLDADVFKWMDIRFGATSDWDSNKQDAVMGGELGQYKNNYASNQTYLGFGFHWGRLHVDTYTDPGMFLDGFNFLSGANNNMNVQISAVYEMM